MSRLWLALPFLLAACADDSFVVVSVATYSGTLDDVAQFRVHVSNNASERLLLYPRQASQALHLDTEHGVTFSVEFDTSRSGPATFEVESLSHDGTVLGYGKATTAIDGGSVSQVTVRVVPGALRPEHPFDAGATDGEGELSCDPYTPAAACGTGQTCALLCPEKDPAVSMCYGGGTANPGDTCASNNDCAPGSQCLTFGACGVMTCLRFCTDDSTCGDPNAYCNVPIPCGPTAQFTACSRPCDPTDNSGGGCGPGLACFVYGVDTTDCACPGSGGVGAVCTQNSGCGGGDSACAGCAAGLTCVFPAGTDAGPSGGICRRTCKVNSPTTCPSGMPCHAFYDSSLRIYGFCQ